MYGVIIGIDIEGYTNTERTDELLKKRKELTEIIKNSTVNIEVFAKKIVLDTGDGCYLLIETGNYEDVLKGFQQMQDFADKANIRFRAVIHVGKYSKSDPIASSTEDGIIHPGYFGQGINDAARYLDAGCLKESLRINKSIKFAFSLSNEFYKQVYDQTFFSEKSYTKYSFEVKNYHNFIFIHSENLNALPDQDKVLDNKGIKITEEFSAFLFGSDFVHENEMNKISDLNTFYVYPDLRTEKPGTASMKSNFKLSSLGLIDKLIQIPDNIVIAGDSQSGKTSLCKKMFEKVFHSSLYMPVYIKFDPKEKGLLSNKIETALKRIYGVKQDENYADRVKLLLLDDFHLLNDHEQSNYIDWILKEKNTFAILTVDSIFNVSVEKRRLTDHFRTTYTISEFGHLLRGKLIDKWIDFNCLENENYCAHDELSEYVEHTFIKGIIPFTPFYILTVLAARSGFVPLNGDLTSKGHCYQALIYISLRRLNVPENYIGAFLNIFSNIAFTLYRSKKTSFNEDELEKFFIDYSSEYSVPFEYKYFLSKIDKSSVFCKNSISQFTFFASYFFHYFVAKYLADRISEENVIKDVEEIYNNLDIETNAYIGIFIVHHSKDKKILEEVLLNTMVLYDKYTEISLNKDEMRHIDDFVKSLSSEIIEKYDKSKENRQEYLETLDKSIEDNSSVSSKEINKDVSEIKKAIRTLEVMGHILKNHGNEIRKAQVEDYFLNALNAYRRICQKFIGELHLYEKEFVDYIIDRINQLPNNSLTREQVIEYAHQYFSFFNLTTIYSTIRRCADSLGSAGMMSIIKEVTRKQNNPLAFCVYFQCEMWYHKSLPLDEAISQYKNFPTSVKFVFQRLLKEFTDLHHIDHKVKQQIASSFDMKLRALDYDHNK